MQVLSRITWRFPLTTPRLPAPVFLGAWCCLLFVYGIATGPLYRTESLRAIIGRECLHGHWLFPVLYGEPFLTKPPGQYVAIALASLPFGQVSAASARIPSILAAAVAVLCFYSLLRRSLDERSAILGALLLPTSILWLDKVPSAEIDMTLLGWVTASLVLFHRAVQGGEPASLKYLVLAWLCVAGGTLTKWTAPAFFALTVIPLLAWRREFRLLWGWRNLLAAGIAVGVCVLWACAVMQQVGTSILFDTISKEAAYRFAPKAAGKGYPWSEVLTYPLLVCAAHLPLSLFALRTFRQSFWQRCDWHHRLLVQLLHCWTWPNLLFWSLVPNHNIRYALPMSPGLMGLGVLGLLDWLVISDASGRRKRLVWGFLALWLVAKVAFVEVVVPVRAVHHNAAPIGRTLQDLVPEGRPLYLVRMKDEGVMFYYARPVFRLSHPREIPVDGYAILMRQEWDDWQTDGDCEPIATLKDQQGDAFVLVLRRH